MASDIKIAIVTPKYPPNVDGGGEISVSLLAEQLEMKNGVTAHVISFDGTSLEEVSNVSVSRIADYQMTPLEISNAKVFAKLLQYRKKLNEVDIIHGYNVYYSPALGAINNIVSPPTVATLNSYVLLPRTAYGLSATWLRRIYDSVFMPTTGRLLRRYVQKIDKLICLSSGSRQVYVENGFNPDSIEVIPNMADPSFDTPPSSRTDNKTRVLYVGSLIAEKGVEYLVEAATYLSDEFEIRIIGDGDQRACLERYASEINVDGKVNFVGRISYSQIGSEYTNSDIFVHPGIWPEPFGRTILEAMEAGLPVVATNVGGPADIIQDDSLLCPPKDSLALATAIKYAKKEEDRIGSQNQRKVMTEYSPEEVSNQIMDLYKRTIENG